MEEKRKEDFLAELVTFFRAIISAGMLPREILKGGRGKGKSISSSARKRGKTEK
jgi:hypothetical protein